MYSPQLLDHFQHPQNAGEIAKPEAAAQLENPVCGDVLKLTLKLDGDCIVDIRFLAKGCVPAMACGSAITKLVKGRTLAEARQVSRDEVVEEVGGLPAASAHAGHLAIDTLRALLKDL